MGRRFITYAISSVVGMYYSALTLLFGFTVSPDRKTFLYSAEKGTTNDLMLVENFR